MAKAARKYFLVDLAVIFPPPPPCRPPMGAECPRPHRPAEALKGLSRVWSRRLERV